MSPFRLSVVAVLALACPAGALAGEGAETMDWPGAVREAVAGNPTLVAARDAVEAAKSGVTSASADFWPSVSASASLNRSGNQALDDWHPVGPERDSTSYSFGGSASWSLFSGWSTVAARRRAQATLVQRQAGYRSASQSLRASLRQSFNRLLYVQRNLDLLASIRDRLNRQARFQEIQFKSGRDPRWTFLKSQADAASITWQITQAQFDRENTRRQVARLLGRGIEGATALVASGELASATPLLDLSPAYTEMERRHPDFLSQQAAVTANEASLTSSRSTRWPSLSARGGYSWSDGGTWPPDSSGWSTGLSLSYPLFAGGGQEASIRAARWSYEGSLATLADTRTALRAALFQAWEVFRVGFDRLPVLRLDAEASAERYKTVEALYQSGRAGYLDFEQAQGALTQAEQSLLSGRLSVAQAEADWVKALGLTLEDEGGGTP
ncbi:MAG: TolC family protein [Candidatus Coatesbacteria bacterium]